MKRFWKPSLNFTELSYLSVIFLFLAIQNGSKILLSIPWEIKHILEWLAIGLELSGHDSKYSSNQSALNNRDLIVRIIWIDILYIGNW